MRDGGFGGGAISLLNSIHQNEERFEIIEENEMGLFLEILDVFVMVELGKLDLGVLELDLPASDEEIEQVVGGDDSLLEDGGKPVENLPEFSLVNKLFKKRKLGGLGLVQEEIFGLSLIIFIIL